MRWLVTGAGGQLGSRLAQLLATSEEDAACLTRAQLDITRAADVDEAIDALRPDVVVNAAAYTAVDAAEADEATALAVNRDGPAHLAAALAARGGRLIHVSTDYVFAGDANRPYEPDDPTGPGTAYGRTKLAGEIAATERLPERTVIVRTAWLFGGPGPNFVDTMRRLERERDTISVVADQIGSPTYAADLASALVTLGASSISSATLHYANTGQASWADLARHVFECIGADPARIRPIATADYPTPAARPHWSVLSTASWESTGLPRSRPWRNAVQRYLAA